MYWYHAVQKGFPALILALPMTAPDSDVHCVVTYKLTQSLWTLRCG